VEKEETPGMFSQLSPPPRSERGITGLETAIILIAFVVVASVFAFTVLSTGVFSSERGKETIFAGLEEAQSSMSPRGSVIAYKGVLADSTSTVFKLTFDVALSLNGQPIDLTPPFTVDGSATDPDSVANPAQVTVVDYIDKNQSFTDVPWSIDFPGQNDGDNILEINERAEITVWLLNRATATAIGTAGSIAYQTTEGGMTSSSTVLTKNNEFTVLIKPPKGATLNLTRTLPSSLDTVMNLN
jgi:flagellin FlaB